MSGALAVRGLLFALLLFQVFVIGSYGNNNSKKSSASCKSQSKAVTAFVQNWAAEHQQATVFQSNCTFAPAPFRDPTALALLQGKMNTSSLAMCYLHEGVCGKTHQYCGVCGKSWHLCADPTFGTNNAQRQVQWSYTAGWEPEADWEDQQWQQQRQPSWSKSPRRRQTPRRRPNRRNGQKAETETAQSAKGKGKTQLADPPIGRRLFPACRPETHHGSLLWRRLHSK